MDTQDPLTERDRPAQRNPALPTTVAALVVEPDAGQRTILRDYLIAAGNFCDVASSPEQGRTLMRLQRYDLILAALNADPEGEWADFARSIVVNSSDTQVLLVLDRGDAAQAQLAFELGAQGFLSRPIIEHEVAFTLRSALNLRRLQKENRLFSHRIGQEVLKQTKELLDTIQRLERSEGRIRRSQEETIYRLARAAEYRDSETGRHLQRMSQYSALLARKSGLDHERCELVRIASPMHDIGKIGIPDQILYKSGRHTQEEFSVMKQHAEIGYTILQGSHSELLDTAAIIAWTHHEKFDGSGYPRGLAGGAIPFEGRVVAIADVFDALTSRRVYKPAYSADHAMGIMNEGAGKHFDPALLGLFWESMDGALEIKERYSDPEPEPGAEGHAASAD
jgi:putative two-component system response regulator